MGYHRPVTAFNAGKQAEFRDRRLFREPAPSVPHGRPAAREHLEGRPVPAVAAPGEAEPYPCFQALGDHPSLPGAPA